MLWSQRIKVNKEHMIPVRAYLDVCAELVEAETNSHLAETRRHQKRWRTHRLSYHRWARGYCICITIDEVMMSGSTRQCAVTDREGVQNPRFPTTQYVV